MSSLSSAERRALKRLAAGGAAARPERDGADDYGIYAQGDRRRRPMAKLSVAAARRLVSSGALQSDGSEDGLILSEAGRALLRRAEQAGAEAFRAQHMDLQAVPEEVERQSPGEGSAPHGVRAGGPAVINRAESPLAWLMRRQGKSGNSYLSHREFAAGERLRGDFIKGRYLGKVTSDWTAPPRGGVPRGAGEARLDPAESVVAARARVARALEHVGDGLERVLTAVCLEGRGLDDVERGFGWPQRSGKVVLQIALARLADYYGYPVEASDPAA